MPACREELQQPVFAAIDVLEFPELHDESIPFMAFTKCLTRLMGAAGVRDFSLQVGHACPNLTKLWMRWLCITAEQYGEGRGGVHCSTCWWVQ